MEIRELYNKNKNITQFLRSKLNEDKNTPQIIELAYDIQAGSYIKKAIECRKEMLLYVKEATEIIDTYMPFQSILLDIGTGEMTTLAHTITKLKKHPSKVYAFDISWSRIFKGIPYAKEHMRKHFVNLIPFVANIEHIPLGNKSVNCTISSHALEPNGKILKKLLKEIFRVTKDIALLFEPCYEASSEEGKQRMDSLGLYQGSKGYHQ